MFPWLRFPSPDALQVALTFFSLLALWFAWARVVGPKVKRGWDTFVGFFQAIAGREAIIDKASGIEKAPAVPPLGHRLASIDVTLEKVVALIESNQAAHHRIDGIDIEIIAVRGDVTRLNHRTSVLEAAAAEKAALHAENAAMFNMVAKRDSDVIDPQEEP